MLGVTEPRLNDLVRRGKIPGAPPSVAGRRFWSERHIVAAAEALGLNPGAVRQHLAASIAKTEEVARG